MATYKSTRRSSARLSGANATPSLGNNDSLRRSALSKSHTSAQIGSAHATPNFTGSNVASGSTFSSANNTAAGIAKARAEFLRENQETPRTTMLELGKRLTGMEHISSNPLDHVNVVNADDHFRANKNKSSNKESLHKTKILSKNKDFGLDASDKQDSFNDLQESMAIHSMAEEALSASALETRGPKKGFQLRRAVRSSKVPSPVKDITNSFGSDMEVGKTLSPDLDLLDFNNPYKENQANNFAKRPIALKRRLTKKRFEAPDLKGLTDDCDDTSEKTSSKLVINESINNITQVIGEFDNSDDSANVSRHDLPRKDILVRRTRSLRSKTKPDLSLETETPARDVSRSADDLNISDDHDKITVSQDATNRKILQRRTKSSHSKLAPDPLINKADTELTKNKQHAFANSSNTMAHTRQDISRLRQTESSLSLMETSNETLTKPFSAANHALNAGQMKLRLDEIKQKGKEKLQEQLRNIRPTETFDITNNSNKRSVSGNANENASKDTIVLGLKSMSRNNHSSSPQLTGKSDMTEPLQHSEVEFQSKQLRRAVRSSKFTSPIKDLPNPSHDESTLTLQRTAETVVLTNVSQKLPEETSEPPIANSVSPKSVYKTPASNISLQRNTPQVLK